MKLVEIKRKNVSRPLYVSIDNIIAIEEVGQQHSYKLYIKDFGVTEIEFGEFIRLKNEYVELRERKDDSKSIYDEEVLAEDLPF